MIQPLRILLLLAVSILTLAGCGRKGPLDLPPTAANDQPPGNTAQGPAFGTGDRPIAAPGKKKDLPIDWLLD
jgi:predicted small lipoprotein YifL